MNTSSLVSSIVNALLTALAGRITLVLKTEFNNAKEEVRIKARELTMGVWLIGIGLAFAFFTLAILITGAILALSKVWEPWLAALVVGGTLALIATILIWIGAVKFNKNKNLVPEKAISNVKAYIGK
jgi:hypothetical protein